MDILARFGYRLKRIENVLITPKYLWGDDARKEMILNIILCISIAVFSVFEVVIIRNYFLKGNYYDGINPLIFGLILIFFILLLLFSRLGGVKKISYVLILSYLASALYCGYQWGVSLPATLLIFILLIQISSILINTKFSLIIMLTSVLSLVLLGIHEYNNPQILNWRFNPVNKTDFITYSSILGFITLLAWLSNREIEKSLLKARKSESELRKERDNLETKVEERANEIRQVQVKRINELSRTAEFGRLAQGLFHDLISPLSPIALHIEKLATMNNKQVDEYQQSICKILEVSQKFSRYMESVRYTMREKMEPKVNNVDDEIGKSVSILNYKARVSNVVIEFRRHSNSLWFGDPIRLHQIFSNLISNAIDACSESTNVNKNIEINAYKNNNFISISFTDNGIGISKDDLEKIFDPFYSTKTPENGTGIGLTSVKNILIEIGGKIKISSRKNFGTIVRVEIPEYINPK